MGLHCTLHERKDGENNPAEMIPLHRLVSETSTSPMEKIRRRVGGHYNHKSKKRACIWAVEESKDTESEVHMVAVCHCEKGAGDRVRITRFDGGFRRVSRPLCVPSMRATCCKSRHLGEQEENYELCSGEYPSEDTRRRERKTENSKKTTNRSMQASSPMSSAERQT